MATSVASALTTHRASTKTEKTQMFRIVYRGITEDTARRLEKNNVMKKTDHTEATLWIWNACDPLETRKDAWRNIMAISLPEHTNGLYDREHDVVILEHNLTLKCIGVAEFKKIYTPDGMRRNIRIFAMELVQ